MNIYINIFWMMDGYAKLCYIMKIVNHFIFNDNRNHISVKVTKFCFIGLKFYYDKSVFKYVKRFHKKERNLLKWDRKISYLWQWNLLSRVYFMSVFQKIQWLVSILKYNGLCFAEKAAPFLLTLLRTVSDLIAEVSTEKIKS